MTTVKQALESAVEAMESCDVNNGYNGENQFYDARLIHTSLEQCKSALAELESVEPVGWVASDGGDMNAFFTDKDKFESFCAEVEPLRAFQVSISPQTREWVGLEANHIANILDAWDGFNTWELAKSIEAKLRELNTKG